MEELLRDRRAYPRLAVSLPCRFSDFNYEWDGTVVSLSTAGCRVESRQLFRPGKDLSFVVRTEEGEELTAEGIVRWVRAATGRDPGLLGVEFDLRRPGLAENTTDFVERLAASDVDVAMRYRAAGRPIPMAQILYQKRQRPPDVQLTNEERTFLACIDGRTDLYGVRQALGPAWESVSYAAFSLLGKGVLTTIQAQGIVGTAQGPRPAPTAKETMARNQKAQEYYEKAMEARATGNVPLALTNLRLAIMLAPGDPEITRALEELEG